METNEYATPEDAARDGASSTRIMSLFGCSKLRALTAIYEARPLSEKELRDEATANRAADARFRAAMLRARASGEEQFPIGMVKIPCTIKPIYVPTLSRTFSRNASPAALCAETRDPDTGDAAEGEG